MKVIIPIAVVKIPVRFDLDQPEGAINAESKITPKKKDSAF